MRLFVPKSCKEQARRAFRRSQPVESKSKQELAREAHYKRIAAEIDKPKT